MAMCAPSGDHENPCGVKTFSMPLPMRCRPEPSSWIRSRPIGPPFPGKYGSDATHACGITLTYAVSATWAALAISIARPIAPAVTDPVDVSVTVGVGGPEGAEKVSALGRGVP